MARQALEGLSENENVPNEVREVMKEILEETKTA